MPVLETYLATQKRVRMAIAEAKSQTQQVENSKREEALDFFDGRDSKKILAKKYAARYAYYLAKVDDDDEGEYYAYKRGNASAAIQAGLYQIAETGTLQRVVRSVATLFTQKDQSFSFVDESGENSDDVSGMINAHRKESGFLQELIRTDRVSVLLSSASIKVTYYNGALKYQGGLGPQLFYTLWPESILDANGTEREPDRADLEDASVVIVKLSDASKQNEEGPSSRYAAYFGRTEEQPNGRYVTYQSGSPYDYPVVGAPEANDYIDQSTGEIANPLTALQNSRDDGFLFCPFEYPFVQFYGQDTPRDMTFPETSFSLYDNTIEMDLMQSRLLKAADVSARGSIAVTLERGGIPPDNPDEGITILREGQTRDIQSVPSSGAKDGQELLVQAQMQISTRYSVPGYEVTQSGGSPESGVALAIRSAAKREARQERINEHQTAVDKLFILERAALEYFGAEGQQIDPGVEQVWDAGTWEIPTDPAVKQASIQAQEDAGYIDHVEAVRLSRGLSSREDAKRVIDEMKADEAEYGKAKEAVPNVLGKIKPRI